MRSCRVPLILVIGMLVGVGVVAAPTLTPQDETLLDEIQFRAFRYFWEQVEPSTGLIRDRSRPGSPSSIAAVGFGLTAIPIGVERGWISRDEALERVLVTLKFFRDSVEGTHGFYYHFVDPYNGTRAMGSEISSIDTAWFIAGALFAGEYFGGEVRRLARELYERVEWDWMLDPDTLQLRHGWLGPISGFLPYNWDTYSEHMLMYLLAIGSPTHPIPAESWDAWHRPAPDGYIRCPTESMFVYVYSHAWIDFRDRHDAYANYWNNSIVAINRNRLFCYANRFRYATYGRHVWGITASDGPDGYKGYGAREGGHDGTVAPYAAISALPFIPEEAMAAIRTMKTLYGDRIWGEYGFTSAFNVDRDWYSTDFIGIDKGIEILMVENYRTQFVWRIFMRNRYIRRAMAAAGFVYDPDADFVLTPEYAAYYERLLAGATSEAEAPYTTLPPSIDGKLDEWIHSPQEVDETMLVPGIDRLEPEATLKGRFWAMWDEHCLYLAAEVEDSVLVINMPPTRKGEFYYTDSIEFYIQPGRGLGRDLGVFKLAAIPFDTEGSPRACRHEDSNPGPLEEVAPEVRYASSRTETGYAMEFAIPWDYLGLAGLVEPGLVLGFSFTVHNSNNPDAPPGAYVRTAMIAWNPVPDVWARPKTWGDLVLGGPE